MKRIGILFLSVLIFYNCEKIDIVEIELEHIPKYVVQAELIGNQNFEGVTITKTLSINETFDIKKAEIRNAVTYLKINGIQVVTLKYSENGLYKPLDDLWIVEGNTYELFARIDDELIYSLTQVPFKPEVTNINVTDEEYLEANISAKESEVYGSVWAINTSANPNNAIMDSDFHSIVSASEDNINTALCRTSILPEIYQTQYYKDYLFIQVYSFDPAYRDYFNTKLSNQPIQDSFAQGGGIINWNVHGNNTIGLFIGLTKSEMIKVN